MKDLVDKFGMRIIQDAINVLKYINKRDTGVIDKEFFLLDALDKHKDKLDKERKDREQEISANSPKCPLCDSVLFIRVVKANNVNNYKSSWYCVAGDCTYEQHSTGTVKEELSLYKQS